MVGLGADAAETAGAAAGGAAAGSKGKDSAAGEKRKRTNFSATQKAYLEQALANGELNTPQKRQKVADMFSKDAGKTIERKVIDTWHRNHRGKNSKDGE